MRGFIDIHTHGIGRYDTRTDNPETILKIAQFHGKAGTAAIVPAIYSGSIQNMRKNMEAIRKAMKEQKRGSTEVKKTSDLQNLRASRLLSGAKILGIHLEGPFLNPVRCGAQDKGFFLKPSMSALKTLIDGYEDIIKIITIAPELKGAPQVIEACVSLGIKVNMGHSDATYNQALDGKKAGARGISHIYNAMRPFHHREPGLIGLGLLDEDIYIEVIADKIHINREVLRLIFRIKRLDRIILVSDSVKGVKDSMGRIYKKPGVLAGSSINLADAVKNVKQIGITEAVVLETAIDNPKRYLGIT
jgi:N-acetylglucosamine-6-phosphate deacetylase